MGSLREDTVIGVDLAAEFYMVVHGIHTLTFIDNLNITAGSLVQKSVQIGLSYEFVM